jgi:hypothetical protein
MLKARAVPTGRLTESPTRLVVAALLVLSVAIRLVNLNSPLFTGNPFRQTMTAITAWTFVEEGISLLRYQTPVFGPPWRIPIEFPLYQATAALIAKAGVGNLDMAGRIAALLYFYVSAVFLFLVCRRYLGATTATCTLLFYVWSPYTIIWSRNFMIDYASVAFSLGYLYFFARWLDDSRRALLFVACLAFGILAFLVKVTTLPTVLIPMAYLALKKILPALRESGYHLGRYIRDSLGLVTGLAALFLLPLCPFVVWLRYTDAVKAASEFSSGLTSSGLNEWNYGTWAQKMNPRNWARIVQWIAKYVVTLPGLVVAALGLPAFFRSSRRGGDFVVAMAAAAVITVFVFFNLYWVHDYYLMAITPAISVVMGFFLALVLTRVLGEGFGVLSWAFVAVLMIGLMLFSRRDDLEWSFVVSYDKPNETLSLAKAIRDNTARDDYVIVTDVFHWDPEYLYYARRKGFMLWRNEGGSSNEFFKRNHFNTIVHSEPHEELFANWKYRKVLGVSGKYKVERVSDTPIG